MSNSLHGRQGDSQGEGTFQTEGTASSGHRDMRAHSIFEECHLVSGKWRAAGHAAEQSRNQELTSYSTVNHWRISVRKVSVPELQLHARRDHCDHSAGGTKGRVTHKETMKAGTRETAKVRDAGLESHDCQPCDITQAREVQGGHWGFLHQVLC